MVTVGIDPGLDGAIVAFDGARLVEVHDMPTLQAGRRRTIQPRLVADIVAEIAPARAAIEQVGTRPGEGAVGAFSFGRGLGILDGVMAALGVPVEFLTPPTWRRLCRVPGGKDGSRARACQLWPEHAHLFARKRDAGRAEAALIAHALMLRTEAP